VRGPARVLKGGQGAVGRAAAPAVCSLHLHFKRAGKDGSRAVDLHPEPGGGTRLRRTRFAATLALALAAAGMGSGLIATALQ